MQATPQAMRRAASPDLSARLLSHGENAKGKSLIDPSKDYELKEKLGTGSFGEFPSFPPLGMAY